MLQSGKLNESISLFKAGPGGFISMSGEWESSERPSSTNKYFNKKVLSTYYTPGTIEVLKLQHWAKQIWSLLSQVGLLDENASHSVKCEFWVNSESFFFLEVCLKHWMAHTYTKKLLIIDLKCLHPPPSLPLRVQPHPMGSVKDSGAGEGWAGEVSECHTYCSFWEKRSQ